MWGQRGGHGRAQGCCDKRERRNVWGQADGQPKVTYRIQRTFHDGRMPEAAGACGLALRRELMYIWLASALPGGIGLLTGRNGVACCLPVQARSRAKRAAAASSPPPAPHLPPSSALPVRPSPDTFCLAFSNLAALHPRAFTLDFATRLLGGSRPGLTRKQVGAWGRRRARWAG